jgi:hypothetical protein
MVVDFLVASALLVLVVSVFLVAFISILSQKGSSPLLKYAAPCFLVSGIP